MRISYLDLKKLIKEEAEKNEGGKGLWHNIHQRRKKGLRPLRPGEKGYPKTLDIESNSYDDETDEPPCPRCDGTGLVWDEGDPEVGYAADWDECPDCEKERTYHDEDGVKFEFFEISESEHGALEEAEYKGRNVKLNKPMRGDVKKFKVYVKNDKDNVVKVNFGDPNMRIRKSNPAARKSFRARHNCDDPGPKWKARYWSCKKW